MQGSILYEFDKLTLPVPLYTLYMHIRAKVTSPPILRSASKSRVHVQAHMDPNNAFVKRCAHVATAHGRLYVPQEPSLFILLDSILQVVSYQRATVYLSSTYLHQVYSVPSRCHSLYPINRFYSRSSCSVVECGASGQIHLNIRLIEHRIRFLPSPKHIYKIRTVRSERSPHQHHIPIVRHQRGSL